MVDGEHETSKGGRWPPPPCTHVYIYTRTGGGGVVARKALPSHPNLTCIWKLEGCYVLCVKRSYSSYVLCVKRSNSSYVLCVKRSNSGYV